MNEPTLVLVMPGQMGIVSCMLKLDKRNEKEKSEKKRKGRMHQIPGNHTPEQTRSHRCDWQREGHRKPALPWRRDLPNKPQFLLLPP